MSEKRPEWLVQALARADSPSASSNEVRPLQPGDIRRLEPMDDSETPARLVLVLEVDQNLGCADLMLLSPDVDMGGDADVVLPPGLTGRPYPLLALTDVRAPAYLVQVTTFIGAVTLAAVEQLHPAGGPVDDERDPRWAWKECELDALTALTAECARELVEGPVKSVIDPESFSVDAPEYVEAAALAAARSCRSGRAALPHEVLAMLATARPNDLPRSSARTLLADVVLRSPGCLLHLEGANSGADVRFDGHAYRDFLRSVVLKHAAIGRRNVRLLTTSNLWDVGDFGVVYADGSGGATEVHVDGHRYQVVALMTDEQVSAYV